LLALKFGKAGKRRATITENDLLLPDVAPAAAIIAECSGVMTASVVEHSYRSYVYAKALGRLAGITFDDMALFAAAMFHDTGAFQVDSTGDGRCFTLSSAHRLDELLKAAGWRDERCEVSAEAVVMHLNPRVAETRPEAHLLNAGSAARRRRAARLAVRRWIPRNRESQASSTRLHRRGPTAPDRAGKGHSALPYRLCLSCRLRLCDEDGALA